MPAPTSAVNFPRLVLVGVALPAALAWVNRAILNSPSMPAFGGPAIAALYCFYVAQIAGVSWAVAKFIQPWPLRWIIYGWTMLLVDLQLAVLVESNYSDAVRCLSSGIFAGQLSVFVVWGILAGGKLVWRLPALAVVLIVYWNCYSMLVLLGQHRWGYLDWTNLVVMQTALLSVLCGCLRLAGFSLELVDPKSTAAGNQAMAPATTRKPQLQFGIRDVLIATTALALLLALAKAGDLLSWRYLRHIYDRGFLFVFTIAIATAAVLIVALWSALGRGRLLTRVITLLVASLATGGPLAWYCVYIGQPRARALMFTPARMPWIEHWYEPGSWWLGWMFLTGALLAASLVIYRTLGYRLVRKSAGQAQQTSDGGASQPAYRVGSASAASNSTAKSMPIAPPRSSRPLIAGRSK